MKNGVAGVTTKKPAKDRPPESVRVRFEFVSPTAQAVAIAGSFNDWHPNVTLMLALGQNRWVKDLILPPGEYQYCLVVDGQWIPDPRMPDTAPNPFGGINSVLKVASEAL